MKIDVRNDKRIPTLDANLCLADMGGQANVVNGYVMGGNEAGEMEEWIEMALCWKGNHDHSYFMCFLNTTTILALVLVLAVDSRMIIHGHWKR
mgnify:CR=1 FL=1